MKWLKIVEKKIGSFNFHIFITIDIFIKYLDSWRFVLCESQEVDGSKLFIWNISLKWCFIVLFHHCFGPTLGANFFNSFRHSTMYIFVNVKEVLFHHRSHPLMDSAVRHEGDAPAFYKRDLVLTTIVVDRQFVDMLRDDITYTVFYAGTSK